MKRWFCVWMSTILLGAGWDVDLTPGSVAFFFPTWAQAGEPAPFLSEAEFRTLVQDLAPKVNLFQEVWSQDPEAEFYGGTSRDFLYWIKGKFRAARSPEETARIAAELRAQKVIDVRDFIIGESDVDVISSRAVSVKPDEFGIRKFDSRGAELFDLSTDIGRTEVDQGYIPAEKIRLSRKGLTPPTHFGNGVKEILEGRLSIEFAPSERFATTHYAKQKLNHPVLLALRYLRLQAMDYFRSYGSEYPDSRKLVGAMDPATQEKVRAVIRSALKDGALAEYLAKPRFARWLNGSVQKAFRSYTSPTAARELFRAFGADELSTVYPNQVEPINQVLFSKYRESEPIRAALKDYGVNESEFFREVKSEFPDGRIYHGTKTEEAFRDILFQGVLPSSSGRAGDGLYGVSQANQAFAENWGGAPERVVTLEVRPNAKVVDLTQGEGARVWAEFQKRNPGAKETQFAEAFGVDVLAYPYTPKAYVVKNAAVLGRPQGVHRQLMSVSEMIQLAMKVQTSDGFDQLAKLVELNRLRIAEASLVYEAALDASPPDVYDRWMEGRIESIIKSGAQVLPIEVKVGLRTPHAELHPEWIRRLISDAKADESLLTGVLVEPPWAGKSEFLAALIKKEGVGKELDILISRKLLRPAWDNVRDPLIEKLIEKGTAAISLADALSYSRDGKPQALAHHPKWSEWSTRVIERAQEPPEEWTQGEVIAELLRHPRSIEHFEWIENFDPRRSEMGTTRLVPALASEHSLQNKDQVKAWIEKKILPNADYHTRLISAFLSDPKWADDRWVEAILAADQPGMVRAQLVSEVFSKEHAIPHPEWVTHFLSLDDKTSYNGKTLKTLIAEHVLANPRWGRHDEWIRHYLDGNSFGEMDAFGKHVLSNPVYADKELAMKFIDLSYFTNSVHGFIENALKQPFWADHPEVIEVLVRKMKHKASPASRQKLNRVLQLPHWKDHAALRAVCDGRDPSYSGLLAAFERGKTLGPDRSGAELCPKAFEGLVR